MLVANTVFLSAALLAFALEIEKAAVMAGGLVL